MSDEPREEVILITTSCARLPDLAELEAAFPLRFPSRVPQRIFPGDCDTDVGDDSDDVIGPGFRHKPEVAEHPDSDVFLSDELDRKSVIPCDAACASGLRTLTRAGHAITSLLAFIVV